MNKIQIKQNKKFGLASKSPRRIELSKMLGLSFEILNSSDAEPKPVLNESPVDYVIRASEFKAKNNDNILNEFVIASDTIVSLEKEILGKPINKKIAIDMITKLNNKTHFVITAISVLNTNNKSITSLVKKSKVKFKNWNNSQIYKYIENNDILDKAGAYAIQDNNNSPVEDYTGCKLNIVGLPVCNLIELLISNQVIEKTNLSKNNICKLIESWQEREGSNP